MTVRDIAANIEDLAVARIVGCASQKGIGGIIHVHEIAELGTVAVNLDDTVFDGEADEPANEPLTVVLDQLTRPVDVGESERAGAHAEDVVVHEVVVLTGGFIDTVDV